MAEGLISENQLNSWRNEFFYKNLIFNYLSQFCIKSFSFSHCIVKKKKRFLAQNTLQKNLLERKNVHIQPVNSKHELVPMTSLISPNS